MTTKEMKISDFTGLLVEYGNAEFGCGAYDADDCSSSGIEEYKKLLNVSRGLRNELLRQYSLVREQSNIDYTSPKIKDLAVNSLQNENQTLVELLIDVANSGYLLFGAEGMCETQEKVLYVVTHRYTKPVQTCWLRRFIQRISK